MGSQNKYVQSVYEMFMRHQRSVDEVLESMVRAHAAELAQNRLPEHCLLRLLARADHVRPPQQVYVERLARLLAASLPAIFHTTPPTNERAMQDAGEGVLIAAEEQLAREAPQVPFGAISVRPDFSKSSSPGDTLLVEFKLIKTRRDTGRTHGEMAKDLVQYPSGCWILFVVFDPERAIRDDGAFCAEFEGRRERVHVQVVR